jgi:hypothetical protein
MTTRGEARERNGRDEGFEVEVGWNLVICVLRLRFTPNLEWKGRLAGG